PGVALVHNNLGMALAEQGKFDEAIAQYTEAMRLSPGDPEPHLLLAKACLAQGKTEKAIEHFRNGLALNPQHAKGLTEFARVLATHENSSIRNGAEAVRLAERAVEITAGQQPMALDVLAMAYAEVGRFDAAA